MENEITDSISPNMCPTCLKPYWDDGSSTAKRDLCDCAKLDDKVSGNMGWECPRCGTVNAPFVRSCECAPRGEWSTGSKLVDLISTKEV